MITEDVMLSALSVTGLRSVDAVQEGLCGCQVGPGDLTVVLKL